MKAHSKNNPCYVGTEMTRLLPCSLGVFPQCLGNSLHSFVCEPCAYTARLHLTQKAWQTGGELLVFRPTGVLKKLDSYTDKGM